VFYFVEFGLIAFLFIELCIICVSCIVLFGRIATILNQYYYYYYYNEYQPKSGDALRLGSKGMCGSYVGGR